MARKNTTKSSTSTEASRSYMERLSFDPRLLTGPIAKYISNLRLVALLGLTIVILGMVSYFNLPKRLNPEVELPIVSVVTVLPGAAPEDVESLVTIPLENELRSAEGLDQITSVSNENVSVISLQFFSQVSREQAKNAVQSLVDGVGDLPDDAQQPQIKALDLEDSPIWTFAITTKGDPRTLMSFAKELQTSLEELPRVDRVETAGFEEQEVVVTLDQGKLQQFGLNPLLLAQTLQKSVTTFPAGNVETSGNSFSLTINPVVSTLDDLRQLKLTVGGEVYSLGDVASVQEQPKPNQQIAFIASSDSEAQRAVTFYVYKISSVSIDDAGSQVEAKVEEELKQYGDTYTLTSLSNTSELITEQFVDLLGEFRSTIILVFVCLLLFLGLRQAVISSFTVPLTFLSAFIFMNVIGMSINFLSLFAFLLALGLLVDDTIVVVSAMTTYYKSGKFSPLETGLLVWRDTIVPIWSTTITTIWSFIPLLLTSGIIGEFIKPIPIVVTATMISSTGIAVLITLPIMILILKPSIPSRVAWLFKILGFLAVLAAILFFTWGNPLLPLILLVVMVLTVIIAIGSGSLRQRLHSIVTNSPTLRQTSQRIANITDKGLLDLEGISHWYYRLIMRVLSSTSTRRGVVIAILAYAVLGFMLLPLQLVKSEFFPKTDQEIVYVDLKLPAGTNTQTTEKETLLLLNDIKKTAETDYVIAEIGRGGSGGFGGSSSGSNIARFSLHLPKPEDRDQASFEISEKLRTQYADYARGEVTVVEESGGPPTGADVQIELVGSNLDQLNGYADQVSEYLKTQPGLVNVNKSYQTGTTQLAFQPDDAKISQAGLSLDQIGLWLRLYASGFTLDSINFDQRDADKEDVVFRFMNSKPDLAGLSGLSIPSQMGTSYPLLSLGSLTTQPNPTTITRKNGSRTITVSAATSPGFNPTEANQKLLAFAETVPFEKGYGFETGGANEENQKSTNSIFQAMGVSAILILITMVIQFNSFRQAAIVLVVIPLAVSSVFWFFALSGTPLSFPALIGVLSLFGIVVTNSMFIVDKINLNLRQGMRLKESIADAGASRLEPIILTKLCTVLGLLPITIADPLWRGLGGAIISGLLIASTIMLLFIPVIYYAVFQKEQGTTK